MHGEVFWTRTFYISQHGFCISINGCEIRSTYSIVHITNSKAPGLWYFIDIMMIHNEKPKNKHKQTNNKPTNPTSFFPKPSQLV